ncbi:uncharacterized protein F4822DRAFT_401447 [Hypoxylon trugodes]|uniref:uncharacterized protein n=1 Tax=Hypoxylon trugodes TaxID=326681 RepID=UPI00219E0D7D|nr:uncharacterized protein F4822DRAFT_401447 [Hypoxylon trugodes]KAI1390287.1 hypothetical protein F4822DRAFT_401447 [Hypoxylon trugodes]
MSSRIRQHDQIGRELPVPVSPFNKCGRSYRAIKALILYWEGDSLNYEPYGPMLEAIALQTAFNGWGWPAEIYEIPFNDPVARTRKFLKKQTGNTGSDELLLVYYVGHGNRSSQGQPFSIYRDRPVDVDDIVEWPVIRSVLEAAKCDVVMFLYCCHGADAWVSRNLVRDKYIGPCGKIMVYFLVCCSSLRNCQLICLVVHYRSGPS